MCNAPLSNRLPREARIKSRKVIEHLFLEGKSCYQFPVKAFYRQVPNAQAIPTVQMTVAVSKKKFKRAVDRNRIKRLLREAYRVQQPQEIKADTQYQILFMYTSQRMPNFKTLHTAVGLLLQQIVKVAD